MPSSEPHTSGSRRNNRPDHPVTLPKGVVQVPRQAGAVVAVDGLVVVDVDALGLLRVEADAEDELALGGELGGVGEFQRDPARVAAEENLVGELELLELLAVGVAKPDVEILGRRLRGAVARAEDFYRGQHRAAARRGVEDDRMTAAGDAFLAGGRA